MDQVHQYLEISTFLITIMGLPAAIFLYLKEHHKQREEREYGTFNSLDEKYIEIQQLCLAHPELDAFDTPYAEPRVLSDQEEKQEEAILLIRISIFERAYLMYQRTTSQAKKGQWEGWELEIEGWFQRGNFKKVCEDHGLYFDKEFFTHFNKHIVST